MSTINHFQYFEKAIYRLQLDRIQARSDIERMAAIDLFTETLRVVKIYCDDWQYACRMNEDETVDPELVKNSIEAICKIASLLRDHSKSQPSSYKAIDFTRFDKFLKMLKDEIEDWVEPTPLQHVGFKPQLG